MILNAILPPLAKTSTIVGADASSGPFGEESAKAGMRNSPTALADAKLKEMLIVPAHRELDAAMQVVQTNMDATNRTAA